MEKKKVYYDPGNEGDYPCCPHCGEIAYDENQCLFCGGEYEIVYPEGARTLTIHREGYTITQTKSYDVYITDPDGKTVMHASCRGPLPIEELEKLFTAFWRRGSG